MCVCGAKSLPVSTEPAIAEKRMSDWAIHYAHKMCYIGVLAVNHTGKTCLPLCTNPCLCGNKQIPPMFSPSPHDIITHTLGWLSTNTRNILTARKSLILTTSPPKSSPCVRTTEVHTWVEGTLWVVPIKYLYWRWVAKLLGRPK